MLQDPEDVSALILKVLLKAFVNWLFIVPNVQIYAFLAASACIYYIALLISECFFPGVDKSLPSASKNLPEHLKQSCQCYKQGL